MYRIFPADRMDHEWTNKIDLQILRSINRNLEILIKYTCNNLIFSIAWHFSNSTVISLIYCWLAMSRSLSLRRFKVWYGCFLNRIHLVFISLWAINPCTVHTWPLRFDNARASVGGQEHYETLVSKPGIIGYKVRRECNARDGDGFWNSARGIGSRPKLKPISEQPCAIIGGGASILMYINVYVYFGFFR